MNSSPFLIEKIQVEDGHVFTSGRMARMFNQLGFLPRMRMAWHFIWANFLE